MESRLVTTARDMGRLILDRRHETEQQRRLAPKIVSELIDARLCRMGLPAELHGLDAQPVEWLQALEILAGFEASVPWIAWNNAFVCMHARFLSDATRAAVFGDSAWLYAQSTRPEGTASPDGEDGYRVHGRWSLVSGCELAEWLFLICRIEVDGVARTTPSGEPETRFVFLRRSEARILDTWHAGGLRGSGSHDVVVEDLHVPGTRSVSAEQGSQLPGALGQVPITATMAAAFAAQVLGVAQASLDTVIEMARTRVTPGPAPDLRDRPAAQAEVAFGCAAVDAARAHLHRCVRALWDRTASDEDPDAQAIRATFSASLHAVEVARRTADAMYAAAGTRAVYVDCPLERANRDLHVMLRHVLAQGMWVEDAGRVHFGLDPLNPLFLL